MDSSPLPRAPNGGKRRVFEICKLDENGEIDECSVYEEEDLPAVVGIDRATTMLSDPDGAELFFVKKDEDGEEDEDQMLSMAEWRMCLDEDLCELPDDVLLKAMGPDAFKAFKERIHAENAAGECDEACEEDIAMQARFHLHFGAGRLGMGLVVPAISASGIPFAIVQRPKRKWIDLFSKEGAISGAGEIEVSNNAAVVVHNVEIVVGGGSTPTLMPPQALIFGSTSAELNDAVSRATSFSCSLGSAMSGVLVPLLERLPTSELDKQPCLFCCENDHDAVMKLKAKLSGRVNVIDCMVDRVCTGRTISTEGVDVASEPWKGSIVVLEPNLKGRLPFSSAIATAPSSALEADYLSERKFTLVNGMHTTLAFMTLGELYRENDGGREYILLKYTKLPRDAQRMCEMWRTARVAQLIDKYGLPNLMEWHDVDTREGVWELLLAHGDQVLVDRFSETDDVVSRVLGGGVANRWLTRLRPVHEWMQEHLAAASKDPTGTAEMRELFSYAIDRDRDRALERGCSLDDADWRGCETEEPLDAGADPAAVLAGYIETLVLSSRKYCSRETEITHKELIKAQRKAGGKAKAPEVLEAMSRQQGKGI